MIRFLRAYILVLFALVLVLPANSQVISTDDEIDYRNPRTYEIGGITVKGTRFLDQNALILLSGLTVGDRITVPGDEIAEAIENLWEQGLFADLEIGYTHIRDNSIFLQIVVTELPRLTAFKFSGISKSDADNLRDEIQLIKEQIVNKSLLVTTEQIIKDYYVNKSYLSAAVDIRVAVDSLHPNHVLLLIDIDRNQRTRIKEIVVEGNEAFSEGAVQRALKETKERSRFRPFRDFDQLLINTTKSIVKPDSLTPLQVLANHSKENIRLHVFKSSKFMDDNFEIDKRNLVARYNNKGFRDAKVVGDTMYRIDDKNVIVGLRVDEGHRYYFRDITWIGNTKHKTETLQKRLGIKKGDVYNKSLLDQRLFGSVAGDDVSALYMDEGYLFFNLDAVETKIDGDSIDMEMRIYEGQQATINRVTVVGNTKTNDHVVMREIRSRPGMLFSRSDIVRTQRELAQLGFFDPEALDVRPKPNPEDGTVDIEYVVAERSSDQLELSGGWGGGRVVGTLGLSFNNFSMRNLFKAKAWRPIPSGDGQRLSIRAQTNGLWFQSYNISFTEPWLGGKKPNAFSLTGYYSVQTNGERRKTEVDGEKIENPDRRDIKILGITSGLGTRLKWPDDYFTLQGEATYQNFNINGWRSFIFEDGHSNNMFLRVRLARNSIDAPIYPRSGSEMSFSVQSTIPYSYFNNKDYTDPELTQQERYKWVEYHKWKFTSSWFTRIVGNMVLNSKVGFGYLGMWNKDVGAAPFERFYLGGSGLTGFNLDGREIIALRGYDDQSVSPETGGTIISKYTMELRYPLSLNPSATIYGLGFLEAGNTWNSFKSFNPFGVKRSAGVGIRLFLPMFGLLGLDWGYRFDDIPSFPGMQRSQVHFTIGMNLGEL